MHEYWKYRGIVFEVSKDFVNDKYQALTEYKYQGYQYFSIFEKNLPESLADFW